MIKITQPAVLFNRQKIFAVSNAVENKLVTENKTVVVFFENKITEQLPPAEKEQLFKILTACKLKEEEVLLQNTAFQKETLSGLRMVYPIKAAIVFGDAVISKNIQLKNYQSLFMDNIRLLKSETLQVLMVKPDKKKLLWAELQKIFELK